MPTANPSLRNYILFAAAALLFAGGAGLLLGVPSERDEKKKEKHHEGEAKGFAADSVAAPCHLLGGLTALPELPEASGVVISRRTPGLLWTHKDSGKPVLFGLDVEGRLKGRVFVAGMTVQDWEDLAIGTCGSESCLYIGDIGDNLARRDHITVYRVPEPQPTDPSTRPAEAFHATYPDGAHDAEALVVSKYGVFVVTKGSAGPIAVYRFPEPLRAGSTVRLEPIATLAQRAHKEDHVTGASTSPDERWIVLRTHTAVLFYDAREFAAGHFARPLRFDVSSLGEPQGEGVAIGADGAVYLVGEGGAKNRPGSFARATCTLSATASR